MAAPVVQSQASKSVATLLRRADLIFTGGLFTTVLLLILPIPPALLDVFLALNIGLSLLVLLAIIYVKDPPEFSSFPTLLLALTLFRLALNISSTRQDHDPTATPARSSSRSATSSSRCVVTRQHRRRGGVPDPGDHHQLRRHHQRARAASPRWWSAGKVQLLDALPGKQMAIDAELNAGIIDEAVATARRVKVQKEADFYGAMDGASKFVRGDAVACIIITLVNVVGGFAIGVFQMDLSLAESLQKFTLLSIGDGLVSQIPALILSVGAGILVTRAADSSEPGHAARAGQLFKYSGRGDGRSPGAGMLAVFGLMPGMPIIPLLRPGRHRGLPRHDP